MSQMTGYRLSAQQRRMARLQGKDATLRTHAAATLPGAWDAAAIEAALTRIVAEREILRTTFAALPAMQYPLQVVSETASVELTRADVPGDGDLHARIAAWMASERERAVDISRGPLLRATLARVGSGWVLGLSAPALIADERTLELVIARVAALCQDPGAADTGSEPIQYVDYAEWSHDVLEAQDNDMVASRRLWDGLADGARQLSFPWGASGGALIATPVRTRLVGPVAALRLLAPGRGASVEAMILACVRAVVSRLCERTDAVLGYVLPGRSADELATAMGPLAVAVPLPAVADAGATLAGLARDIDAALTIARQGEQSFLTADREARAPFSVLLELRTPVSLPAGVSVVATFSDAEPFALKLVVTDHGDALELALYRADSVPLVWAERVLARLGAVIGDGAARPDATLASLRPMGPDEERDVLVHWNRTGEDVAPACVHELFAEQVRRTPDATALVFGDASLTYQALHERAVRLADALCAAGVRESEIVALCMPRSLGLVVGALGILEAGAAFLPMDPKQPPELIQAVMDSARPRVMVTTAEFARRALCAASVIVDRDGVTAERAAAATERHRATPADLAYVISTSGSTGERKSVAIEHRAVANLRVALRRAIYEPEIGPGGRRPTSRPLHVIMNAPLSVDASIKQLITLLDGHTLHVIDEELRNDPRPLLRYIERWGIDVIDVTPSQLTLLEWAGFFAEGTKRPAVMLVGGEPIPAQLWATLAACRGTSFYNLYGPTECTVDTTIARITADAPEPHIGPPVVNARVYVLDSELQPVPLGVRGELCIAGAGLSRGYLGDAAATERAFVTWRVPAYLAAELGADTERIYRSGDVGRWLPDGTLAIQGRLDHQLKIRGHRVEIGEIEAVLRAHPLVRDAAVVAVTPETGSAELRAYIVQAESGPTGHISTSELRAHLGARLPDSMIPAVFLGVDALPLNPSGKLDRLALATLQGARVLANAPYEPPGDELERLISQVWQELLSAPRVGASDNFFDLGGHSLLLPQVASQLEKSLGAEVPIIKLIEYPTVRALATFLGGEPSVAAAIAQGKAAGAMQRQARTRVRGPVHGQEAQ